MDEIYSCRQTLDGSGEAEMNQLKPVFNSHLAGSPRACELPGAATHCEACDRIAIGAHYDRISPWRVLVSLPFVYLPVLMMPFILIGGLSVYIHLRLMGASNLKSLREFLPSWDSHRYSYRTQIVKEDIHPWACWAKHRIFWTLNCTLYCPFSVAALEWVGYLTKTVENWWCPFNHAQKSRYATSAIDFSFWHVSRDVAQLHPEDRDNPIWNHTVL
jgi:hypothetical protein